MKKLSRQTITKVHVYCTGVSLCLLLMFIFSGSLHLLGFKETEKVAEVVKIEDGQINNIYEIQSFLLNHLKENDPSYKYDYLKIKSRSIVTRPTTRTYYVAKYSKNQLIVERRKPSLRKRFMELHKGHGPKGTKTILAAVALLFAFAILSGLWLGLTSRPYKKITIATVITSFVIVIGIFNL